MSSIQTFQNNEWVDLVRNINVQTYETKNVTVPADGSSYTTINTISLGKGKWILLSRIYFQAGSSGGFNHQLGDNIIRVDSKIGSTVSLNFKYYDLSSTASVVIRCYSFSTSTTVDNKIVAIKLA